MKFFLNVFSEFSDKNICYYSKRIQTCHLLCKRPACYHSTSKTHARGMIFKLNPIHASVIYPLADPRGGARDARPPWGSKFFHFHAVFGKKLRNNSIFGSWRPPLGKILDPPLLSDYQNSLNSLNSMKALLHYCPQRSCGKVMFLHLSVSHSVHRGCLPQCMLGYTPHDGHCSGRYASYWNALLNILL